MVEPHNMLAVAVEAQVDRVTMQGPHQLEVVAPDIPGQSLG